jgi:integrase
MVLAALLVRLHRSMRPL